MKLVFTILIFLVTTCFDNVFNIRWLDTMQNYTVFAGGILFPLSGILFFSIPMVYLKYKGKLTYENTDKLVSRKDLIIIALFDSLNSILQSIPAPYLTVVSMAVFNRLSLVGMPFASKYFLNRKYLSNHYLAIFLTLYAISVTFIPEVIMGNQIGNWWLALYILGIIPSIFSFIYKEARLQQQPEIWWFNTWVCIYQFAFGILFLPLNILFTSMHTGTSFKEFGKQLTWGFVCQFAGKNMQEGDNCDYAFFWFMLFNILTTIMNVLMFIIIRDGSSIIFILTNTLKTPITSFLGSFKVFAGDNYQKLNISYIYSFVLLIVSTIIYNWQAEIKDESYNFEEYVPIKEKQKPTKSNNNFVEYSLSLDLPDPELSL